MTGEARTDWEERIGRRGVPGQDAHHGAAAGLARPAGLRAVSGQGHVTLDWDPVPRAGGPPGRLSEPVAMAPGAANGARPTVTIEVGDKLADELERPWEPMIGSE